MSPPFPVYDPPLVFRHPHLSTVMPAALRRVRGVVFKRFTLDTADGDFIDLDIFSTGSPFAVILLHGLEGSSQSTYMLGMASALQRAGLDVIAMNQRSCSGRPNNLPGSYHSGKTDDLDLVVRHTAQRYERLAVVGFSLGGNITLKWAGEQGNNLYPQVCAVAGISVPCDLGASALQLGQWFNRVYLNRFLFQLKAKVAGKCNRFSLNIPLRDLGRISTFREFDDLYTAPFHGFRDAEDYYAKCSARQFIPRITVPAMLINACNDPFLTESCHARQECAANPNVHLITPVYGGHLGFANDLRMARPFWHEERVCEFLSEMLLSDPSLQGRE